MSAGRVQIMVMMSLTGFAATRGIVLLFVTVHGVTTGVAGDCGILAPEGAIECSPWREPWEKTRGEAM